ncbi:MAG: glycosyltransferase family 2 protein [Erysipelotrichaceae bacterium]|nr:glycosyltransferase family 2 protein [Erysipelotrichaceae bacterium]
MGELVSIIIPVYNSQDYLEQCLDSILNQTYSNLEVILIDNCSTDSSLSICEKYQYKDDRVKILNETKKGCSAVRNTGMKYMSGKYVCFADSDDWMDREAIEKCVSEIELRDADMVMYSYVREYENRSAKRQLFDHDMIFEEDEIRNTLRRRLIGLYGEELRHPELADSFSTAWAKLYRADYVREIEFIDNQYIGTNEDGLFNLDYLLLSHRIVYINQFYYHYRKPNNDRTATSSYNVSHIDRWNHMIGEIRNRIDPNDPVQTTALQNRICISIIGQAMNVVRSRQSLHQKKKVIADLLNLELYQNAFKELQIEYFSAHWKIFFYACKNKQSTAVLLMAEAIFRLRKYVG